jgi:hypothetical protein
LTGDGTRVIIVISSIDKVVKSPNWAAKTGVPGYEEGWQHEGNKGLVSGRDRTKEIYGNKQI